MAQTSGDRITLAAAAARIDSAIELGELTARYAPAGHPIFAAIEDAKQARDELLDLIPLWSGEGNVIAPGSRTWANMERVIARINDAAASVRTPGPLAATVWPSPSVPWGLVVAGSAALVLGWFIFKPGRRRR